MCLLSYNEDCQKTILGIPRVYFPDSIFVSARHIELFMNSKVRDGKSLGRTKIQYENMTKVLTFDNELSISMFKVMIKR